MSQRLQEPTMEEGVLDISLNFLASAKSHNCIARIPKGETQLQRM